MFRPEDVGLMDESWEGHVMRHTYLQGRPFAGREEVTENRNGYMFWGEASKGVVNNLGVFSTYFLAGLLGH